ncbi:DNA-binding transcriptional regulator, MarR family [Paenibacillus tianmuensis]|uniref:DNA-binding transcriptional regulator, MarR family n=1 Tax=Paenibacillus tianmuensis TaxID=624147 RepID=A0A1G4SH22_9BACL|nr:MarR family transcriptional regulator [Paenibacillus tianmuensis]SCW68460.1 DNA-binding transcriptional regulator, MarR family [Paenibacillus tianmuensis]
MERKTGNERTADQQLPALGIAPYLELMDKTAADHADRKSIRMGLVMLWLSDNILDVMDVDLAPFGVTESKLDMLLLLMLHEGRELITPSGIADRLGIRRASVTALLDWLEKRGWVSREQSAKDRRMIHVSITPEGRAMVDQVLPTFWSTCASLLGDLDAEERSVFEKILGKLHQSIEKRVGVGR